MISEKHLLAAIYGPLILLLLVTLWRMGAAYLRLAKEGWVRSQQLVQGVIAMLVILLLEQLWYGFGRFDTGMYQELSNAAFVVGLFKLGYVGALLLWTRAFFTITGEPPAWRCAVALGLITFFVALFLAFEVSV
tara:strand:+ start:186 stop:587 length:402 start_codon:yes stop_codon:yes gene_type:complete